MKQVFNRPQAGRFRAWRQQGFTLVELMVGLTIGLLSTLVIAGVLRYAEGNKRSATSGSDAQVNGGLAIYAIQRQLKMAGYGLTTVGAAEGCALSAQYAGANVVGLPPTLAPVLITAGGAGASDTVRILSAATTGFSLPSRLGTPFYDPTDIASDKASRIVVSSSVGANKDDLMVMVYGVDQACQVFQVSDTSVGAVRRNDSATWNANKFPTAAATDGTFVLNLGSFSDISFSVTADQKLRQTTFDLPTRTTSRQDMQSNVMDLQALYGKDTNGDDVIDTFDRVTPANNAQWLQVRAVRIAVVARSGQYEKEEVTPEAPKWVVGKFAAVAGSAACGDSQCLNLNVGGAADWKHYRYKVFELTVPLRNQVWRSDVVLPNPPAAPATEAAP